MPIFQIGKDDPFPPLDLAEPNGLLAIGGELSVNRLIQAYSQGVFPWNNADSPLCWWSPDPRMVLEPKNFHLSHSMRSLLRKETFTIALDTCFSDVLKGCAQTPRGEGLGTWLHPRLQQELIQLHLKGMAHSVEVFIGERLVGGLYAIQIGSMFFGESMFSLVNNASKAALYALCQSLPERCLIDCQQHTDHLESLGARLIPRSEFQRRSRELQKETLHWTLADIYPF